MQILDIGFIIEIRKYSEKDAIISIFSKENGVISGIVKAYQSKNNRHICQIGNQVSFIWKARLADHLGFFSLEVVKPIFAIFMQNRVKLTSLCAIFRILYQTLPERLKEEVLYIKLEDFFEKLQNSSDWIRDFIFFELLLLSELGYGLDFTKCVASNSKEELIYISPKSGKAVSKKEGEPYKNILFHLPEFLINSDLIPSSQDIANSLKITEYFINKFILIPKNLQIGEYRKKITEIFASDVKLYL